LEAGAETQNRIQRQLGRLADNETETRIRQTLKETKIRAGLTRNGRLLQRGEKGER
jgi:hypothetical protein